MMFYLPLESLKKRLIQKTFLLFTKEIFKKPMIDSFLDESDLVILTMLQEKDVQMYMLAIYSIAKHITMRKVVIICDSSLSEKSKKLICQHIKSVDFYEAEAYQCEKLPKGGTWERLHAIATLVSQYYVIQMDADILTIKRPEEVIEYVKNNRSFILGANAPSANYTKQIIETSEIVASMARNWIAKWEKIDEEIKIQAYAEAVLEIAAPYGFSNYTRGCSGFAGFAKGSITLDKLYKISEIFNKKLGDNWLEWGSEQFASNLLLSNAEPVSVLPIERYNSADNFCEKSVLLHFIGFVRFSNFLYLRLARACIKQIQN